MKRNWIVHARGRKVYGVGINNADYKVEERTEGGRVECEFYKSWKNMMARCYSESYQRTRKSYVGCSVSKDWHSFMRYREWMASQEWRGMHLDKDILTVGNKIYSHDKCIFISQDLNKFTIDRAGDRGEFPLGVRFHAGRSKYQARCSNPFTKIRESLGFYSSPDDAHQAWRNRKHELALIYASQQADPRIARALSIRYANSKGDQP